jgi:pimeloyl-ACP methyl ester carboxylesterase
VLLRNIPATPDPVQLLHEPPNSSRERPKAIPVEMVSPDPYRGSNRRSGVPLAPRIARPVPMAIIELSTGPIEYRDTGGDGPPTVLLHGLLMDASLWDAVVTDLSADHRCVTPTLPFGAHRLPMHSGTDLSLGGIASLVSEFLDRLGLDDVTLVGNDTGGALVQVLIARGAPRTARVVLASCDTFEDFPPGLTGKALFLTGKLPAPLFGLFMQQMRLRLIRRQPFAFGWLTKRGDATTRQWMNPILTQRMPIAHGRRLAQAIPKAEFTEIGDSLTLLPLDQPAKFAKVVRNFLATSDQTYSW